MQTVAQPGTDLTPSRLAFGSALLMARLGRRESVRMVDEAHNGIAHFDSGRSHGSGEAESPAGEFLSRRRKSVTVATKLGIVLPRRLQATKLLALVAYALDRDGVVLSASTTEQCSVRAALLDGEGPSSAQVEEFASLVRGTVPRGSG